MRILVTGGTGFIGQALVRRLRQRGAAITALSRRPDRIGTLFGREVTAWTSLAQWRPEIAFDAVVNLAGEPIIDRPWTAARRQSLRDSRIGITGQLVDAMGRAERKPGALLSGSAVGIYGDAGPTPVTEACPAARDFAAELCSDWERAAAPAAALGVRTCLLRTGLVLHADGGLLRRMQLPFRLGLGSRLGDGCQMMSWIHRQDYLDAVLWLLDHPECRGAFNLTAPHPVSNAEFTRSLAASLGRPAFLVTPAFLLKAALGNRSILLLGGQNAPPERLLQAGFRFRYPRLADALAHGGLA